MMTLAEIENDVLRTRLQSNKQIVRNVIAIINSEPANEDTCNKIKEKLSEIIK